MDVDPSHTMDDADIAGSVVTLERLDAFIAWTVSCIREDGSDKVGGHKQKLYHNIFLSIVSLEYIQLVGSITSFVQYWCLNELELSAFSFCELVDFHNESSIREATLVLYVPSLKRGLIAGSWLWFRKHIFTDLDVIQDRHIVEYDSVKNEMERLGERTLGTCETFDYDFAEAYAKDEIIPVGSEQ